MLEKLTPEGRRALQLGGGLLLVVGIILLGVLFFLNSLDEEDAAPTYNLKAEEITAIETSAEEFITTSGTFGGKKLESTDDFMNTWVLVLSDDPAFYLKPSSVANTVRSNFFAANPSYPTAGEGEPDDYTPQVYRGGFWGITASDVTVEVPSTYGQAEDGSDVVTVKATFTSTLTAYTNNTEEEGMLGKEMSERRKEEDVAVTLIFSRNSSNQWKVKRVTDLSVEGVFAFDTRGPLSLLETAPALSTFKVDNYPPLGTSGDPKSCVLNREGC